MDINTVISLEDLAKLDDTTFENNYSCLVENYSWFLIDRECTKDDDHDPTNPMRTSVVNCFSMKGRWVIMTPQTVGLVIEQRYK